MVRKKGQKKGRRTGKRNNALFLTRREQETYFILTEERIHGERDTDMTTLAYNNHVRKMIREGIDPKQIIKQDLRVMLDDVDSGKMTREEVHGKFMHFSRVILDIAAEEKKRIGGN
jgi:hypothetical protein